MADWGKWDGTYNWDRLNNKNRPAGVGTVSQSRRARMKAKALKREADALNAPEVKKEEENEEKEEEVKEGETRAASSGLEFGPSPDQAAKEWGDWRWNSWNSYTWRRKSLLLVKRRKLQLRKVQQESPPAEK